VPCCAVLCCAVLCCAVLCCAVLCCAELSWAASRLNACSHVPPSLYTHNDCTNPLPAPASQLVKLTPEEMMELEDVEPEESKLSWDFE